jgi:hypothetical protein
MLTAGGGGGATCIAPVVPRLLFAIEILDLWAIERLFACPGKRFVFMLYCNEVCTSGLK